MAKAKAAEESKADKISDKAMGPGWKQCPHCSKYIKGPATEICYSCGKPFPKPASKSSKPQAHRPSVDFEATMKGLEAVRAFVKEQGTYGKAYETIATVLNLETELGNLGAVKQAIELLEKLSQ